MQCAPPQPRSAAELLHERARETPEESALQASFSEVFPETAADGAATGFALAHLAPEAGRPLLWVQDRLSRKDCGLPYLAGLAEARAVLRVSVSRARDVLWAMEEGLGCAGLSGVIGEIWGEAPAADFTATKRLALRAEAHGVPCWLMRRAAEPGLSAARERWRVASLPSERAPHDRRAPGAPRWRAELFRSRFRAPGTWVARHDGARLVLEHGSAGREETGRALRDGSGSVVLVGPGTADHDGSAAREGPSGAGLARTG